jgi:hypothetical protein
MSAAQTPIPPRPAVVGATQGIPAPQQGNLKALFEQNVAGSVNLIRILARTPGVDQAKLKQAVDLLQQGMHLLSQAVQPVSGGGAGASPQPAAPPSAAPLA